jgi:CheY-specific phosphatase CheX
MPEALNAHELRRLLNKAAQEVLETMFFLSVEEGIEDKPDEGPRLWYSIEFRGNPPGSFQLGMPSWAGRSVAAMFLGLDADEELSSAQVENVLLELTNVVCGNALSRLESSSTFELDQPVAIPEPGDSCPEGTTQRRIPLDTWTLELRLRLAPSL